MPTDIEMESVSLMELLSLAEDVHVKTREASQNTDLDIQKYLRSNNALQSLQGKLENNNSK